MTTEPFDAQGFIRTMIGKGWKWSNVDNNLLLHPTDHDFYIQYDSPTDRITISPKLDEHLKLVIPTPAGKSKTFR